MSRVVICVGDSITGGFATTGYPRVLQGMLNQRQPNCQWSVKDCSQHAASTSTWLSGDLIQQFKQMAAGGCDAIVIMLGTNDVRAGAQPSFEEQGFTERLTQLTKKIMSEAPGAQVFLACPPPGAMGEQYKQARLFSCFDIQILNSTFPRLIPQIAARLGVNYIDVFSAFGGSNASSSLYGPDGLHLEKEGDARVAAAVCEHIANRFCGTATARNHAATTASLQGSQSQKFHSQVPYVNEGKSLSAPVGSAQQSQSQRIRSQVPYVNEGKSLSIPVGSAQQRMNLMYQAPAGSYVPMVTPRSYNTISASCKTVDVPQSQSVVTSQVRPTSYNTISASHKTVDVPQSQSVVTPQVRRFTSSNAFAPRSPRSPTSTSHVLTSPRKFVSAVAPGSGGFWDHAVMGA